MSTISYSQRTVFLNNILACHRRELLSFLNRTYIVRDIKATGKNGDLIRGLMRVVASITVHFQDLRQSNLRERFKKYVESVNDTWPEHQEKLNELSVAFISVTALVPEVWKPSE